MATYKHPYNNMIFKIPDSIYKLDVNILSILIFFYTRKK